MTVAEQLPLGAACVMLLGQVMDGACPSKTTTLKEQLVLLPEASVARKVLVVVPIGKAAPLASPAVCVVVTPVQLSVPEGEEKVTVAVQTPEPTACVIVAGQLMPGAVLSTLFTVKVQVLEFKEPSVAKMLTVMAPVFVSVVPAAGDWLVVGAPGQLSVIVASGT